MIASEGTETEPRYFEEFKSSEWHQDKSIFIEVLERKNLGSNPQRVLKQLKDFKKEYRLTDRDELWMLIDRDRQAWTVAEIDRVAQECLQSNFGFAMSNPAFEIWLLLHLKNLNEYSQETKDEFLQNRKTGNRTRLESELVTILGSFNKSNLDAGKFLPGLQLAIDRSQSLDNNPSERWPNHLGTHVYKLIKRLTNSL